MIFLLFITFSTFTTVHCQDEDDIFPYDDGYKFIHLSKAGQNLMRCMVCFDLFKAIFEELEPVYAAHRTKETYVVEAMDKVSQRFGKHYGRQKGLPVQIDGTELYVSTTDYNDQLVHILEDYEEDIEKLLMSGSPDPKKEFCLSKLQDCTYKTLEKYENAEKERKAKKSKKDL